MTQGFPVIQFIEIQSTNQMMKLRQLARLAYLRLRQAIMIAEDHLEELVRRTIQWLWDLMVIFMRFITILISTLISIGYTLKRFLN